MPKISKKDPEKPKGAKNPYNFFLQENKEQLNEKMSFEEFSKNCAEKWKSMTEEDKKPFIDKAAEDKERYKTEMASYSPPPAEEEGTKKKKKKQQKDPNKPKRNLNPYLFFLNEKREEVKEGLTNPTASEVVKILGDMWSKLPDDDKKQYKDMAQKDKERYQQEMEEYKEKQSSN